MSMELKWSAPGEDFSDAAAIREEVFCREQGYDPSMEFDDEDQTAWHLVLLYDHQPAACGRVLEAGDGVFHLGRIAVKKELRRHHLGAALVQEMMRFSKQRGASRFELGAQCQARGFYESLGFQAYGECYPDGHIPHIKMTCQA